MKPSTNRRLSMLRSLAVAGLLGLGGCVAHGHIVAYADASPPHFTFVDPPMLVTVAPGVWVVHDYHAQILFTGGAYWHLSGGTWYRAEFYDGDWIAVATIRVPLQIRHIEERRYVYFKGEAGAELEQAPPAHAAAQHGGPPGQRDEPGLRRGHDKPGNAKPGNAKPGNDKPGNAKPKPGKQNHGKPNA
jgi:hypothetical protein